MPHNICQRSVPQQVLALPGGQLERLQPAILLLLDVKPIAIPSTILISIQILVVEELRQES
jgi:hypothetical protein